MPRKFFRRISRQYRRKQGPRPWYLRPFQALLEHPVYFAANRRSIAGGIAIGLFVGLLPMPGHTPVALIAALLLRVNLALAVVTIWIANPLTYAPIFYLEYQLGALILGEPPGGFTMEFTWQALASNLAGVWKPLWLGALIAATVASLLGYLLTSAAWRWSAALHYRRRPGARRTAGTR